MDGWQITASIATIAQAIIVAVSLFFIWRQVQQQTIQAEQQTVQAQQQTLQVRQQTELAKAANAQALVEMSSPFNILFAQDEKVAELWLKGPREFESFTEVEKFRYRRTLIWHLVFSENIFLQNKNKLLDDYIYSAWNAALASFVERQNLKDHWRELEGSYHADFREHIDKLIATKSAA